MTTVTPNMNLPVSTINVDSGLTWEQNLNASLTLIDQHNHAPGYGVPIDSGGLNLTSDLSFNNNSATSLSSIVFSPVLSLSTQNAIYSIGADLYYNDSNGNVVQITSGGAVNATSSGISSGTATASFVSSVLVVNAASNTPANIQGGSLLLGNNTPASKFLTLSPPAAMGSDFSLTLPSQPGTNGNFVTINTDGTMASTVGVDNATLVVASNVLKVPNSGITFNQIASNTIIQSNIAIRSGPATSVGPGGICLSNDIIQTITAGSFTVFTNSNITIQTLGNPVIIMLVPSSTGVQDGVRAEVVPFGSGAVEVDARLRIKRGTTVIGDTIFGGSESGSTSISVNFYYPLGVQFVDFGAVAGTYTYTMEGQINTSGFGGSPQLFVQCRLFIYEIK